MNLVGIIVTLLIFSVLVTVHEFGHFIVARRNGILVEEFAIGMGPLIYGKEKNGTLYSLRLLPIGGYCKMLGESPDEEGAVQDERSFSAKTVLQRIAVCLAGVVMNYFLAVFLSVIIVLLSGFTSTEITAVVPDSPAEKAGIMAGDKIVEVNGSKTSSYKYLSYLLNKEGKENIVIKYERDGQKFQTNLTPMRVVNDDGIESYQMGISLSRVMGHGKITFAKDTAPEYIEYINALPKVNILQAGAEGFKDAGFYVYIVIDGFGEMVKRNVSLDDVSGVIGVGSVINESIQETSKNGNIMDTIVYLIYVAALLSANLAVLNLLPIPALDGGRILFLIIEGIRKKPMDPNKEGWIQLISFALVIILAIVIAFNDVIKIIR